MNNIKENIGKFSKGTKWLAVTDGVIVLVVIAVIGGFYWQFQDLHNTKNKLASTTAELSTKIDDLEAEVIAANSANRKLFDKLAEQSAEFEDAIDDISGTVNTLEKLSKTDKELLQKYSRVYFLSENYVPMRLSEIDEEYVFDPAKVYKFHTSARPYLEDMLEAAQRKDIEIKVASAYRSFAEQTSLKSQYLVTYGTGSNQFSADQGYSEHQLGTTVDLVDKNNTNTNLLVSFENTEAFKWLSENAYKYGFVLSYPKNNSFYDYEPWHWRFVGVKLATRLHRDGLNFADMEQRDIDTYLVRIFD